MSGKYPFVANFQIAFLCTRLRCYIVAYKHCDLFCGETSYFPWRNQQETLKNSLKIRVFIVRGKKIKFKKCARTILDSDNKMPSCLAGVYKRHWSTIYVEIYVELYCSSRWLRYDMLDCWLQFDLWCTQKAWYFYSPKSLYRHHGVSI